MKFLLDMPTSQHLVGWLRGKGYDAVHAREIGLATAADHEILDRARGEGRLVLTMDLDFPHLLAALSASGPGVILVRLRYPRFHAIQQRLEALLAGFPEAELARAIAVLEESRVRLHRLPVR